METHKRLLQYGYSLQNNGGVWQYKAFDNFINLFLSNSYSYTEVVDFVNKRYKVKVIDNDQITLIEK